jgi:hypothetical protein
MDNTKPFDTGVLYFPVYIEFDRRPFFPAKPQRSDGVSVVSLFHYPTVPLPLGSCPLAPSLFFASPFCTILGQCKSLSYNTYGSLASVANKRLALWLTRLDATLTRNIGGGVHFLLPQIFYVSLATRLKFFPFIFLRTLLRIFATWQNSTPFFSSDSALFAKNHPGWGVVVNQNQTISAARLFQLQSPGPVWHAANPLALWAQERKVGSEVHE